MNQTQNVKKKLFGVCCKIAIYLLAYPNSYPLLSLIIFKQLTLLKLILKITNSLFVVFHIFTAAMSNESVWGKYR
jgi:hypothetical protein